MSLWQELQVEKHITDILHTFRVEKPDHLGQPFVSAYQIAVELFLYRREVFDALGLPLEDTSREQYDSLAHYITQHLSASIKDGSIRHIEIAWLSCRNVSQIDFDDYEHTITASMKKPVALTLFRLYE